MQSVPKRVFTHEYRAEAVKLVFAEGLGVSEAARKLGMSVKTYSKWIRDARTGVLARVDTHRALPVTDLQAEVSRLKRELAIACEERDILKNSPHGTPRPLWVETSGAATAALIRPIRARMGGATLSVRSGSAR